MWESQTITPVSSVSSFPVSIASPSVSPKIMPKPIVAETTMAGWGSPHCFSPANLAKVLAAGSQSSSVITTAVSPVIRGAV